MSWHRGVVTRLNAPARRLPFDANVGPATNGSPSSLVKVPRGLTRWMTILPLSSSASIPGIPPCFVFANSSAPSVLRQHPMTASKNGTKTRGQPFKPGNPGGPGRPEGSRNKASIALDKLAEADGEEILRATLNDAKAGDPNARKLVLDRIWPIRKGRPVSLSLPSIATGADVVAALGLVAEAVGAGELTPEEGASVASVLEIKRKAIETAELDARITALEMERKS